MKDLRRRVRLVGAREDAVDYARFRIGLGAIGERKEIDRKEDVEVLQRIAGSLSKTMIEGSATRAANLIEHAVEHATALLVLVEALIEKMPQITSALRHA